MRSGQLWARGLRFKEKLAVSREHVQQRGDAFKILRVKNHSLHPIKCIAAVASSVMAQADIIVGADDRTNSRFSRKPKQALPTRTARVRLLRFHCIYCYEMTDSDPSYQITCHKNKNFVPSCMMAVVLVLT